ncbi:MAG: CHAT domain-containing tetratricopeptide repeat protein, partial [Cyanobacteria bacterium J06649_11]
DMAFLKGYVGDFDLSTQYMFQAEMYLNPFPTEIDLVWAGLGTNMTEMGRFAEAIHYFRLADSIQQLNETPKSSAMTKIEIVKCLTEMDSVDKALAILDQAESFLLQDQIPYQLRDFYTVKGKVLTEQGKLLEAEANLQTALFTGLKAYPQNHPHIINNLYLAGKSKREQKGKEIEAMSDLQEALQIAFPGFSEDDPASNPQPDHFKTYHTDIPAIFAEKGKAFEQLYEKESFHQQHLFNAYNSYLNGVNVLKNLKKEAVSAYQIETFISQSITNYEGIQRINTYFLNAPFNELSFPGGIASIPGDLDFGFHAAQQAKASALQRSINTLETTKNAVLPRPLQDELTQKAQRIRQLSTFLKLANEQQELDQIRQELSKTRISYDSLLYTIQEKFPAYYEFKYEQPTVSVSEIQYWLDDSTMVLDYFFGDQDIYLYAISKRNAGVFQIPLTETFVSDVIRLKYQLNDSDSESWDDNIFRLLSNKLYKAILGPVLNDSLVNTLWIIPDGNLNFIPFEALLSQEVGKEEVRNDELPYLVKDYNIQYHFSSYLLYKDWQELANQKEVEVQLLAFAPTYSESLKDEFRSNGLAELMYNKEEARSIANAVKGGSVLGQMATEENFWKLVTTSTPLMFHFSGHAALDNKYPGFSSLFMSSVDHLSSSDSLKYDGVIYAHELAGRPIGAKVAVLSACQSASGQYIVGKGVQSLASFFRAGGCVSLVASIWNASDSKSNELMQLYYEYLNQEIPMGTALSMAKRAYLQKSRSGARLNAETNPRLWSNFISIGKSPVIVFIPWWKPYVIPIVIGSCLLILGLGLWIIRRQRKNFT